MEKQLQFPDPEMLVVERKLKTFTPKNEIKKSHIKLCISYARDAIRKANENE
jgi:hypothetical protein